jgi:5-(carboxyamino)imidazole ribonucleotide synthase
VSIVPPGSTIGILGTGQLGRMTALAAAELGYRCHVFGPDANAPATQVAAASTLADYHDAAALDAFARTVDVVTYEFENIPHAPVAALAERLPMRPHPDVLRVCQDRIAEKSFLGGLGISTAKFREVRDQAGLVRAIQELGRPTVLKTAQLGYDGKGQVVIRTRTDLEEAWRGLSTTRAILEEFVDFACEISVVVARGLDGQHATYVPVENVHKNGILDQTIVPARVSQTVAMKAEAIARHIAQKLGLVGVLAVEMFVVKDDGVLVNELAPRPHNSGHWTLDACATSQFEQVVRAICGLPLGSPERFCDATMKNLIGDDVNQWRDLAADPMVKLHLYGKTHVRPGRKMGHATRLTPRKSSL